MLKFVFKGLANQSSLRNYNLVQSCLFKRNFLSSAYELEPEYNARLNNNILKQVNPSSMYLELDQQYNRHKKLYAIDVDLYVNSITNDIYTEELEDILYKFRLTPTTIDMMDSTQHAVIRLYLKLNKIQELLTILDDRLNYGIFPDEYCNNLLMNYFIKTNNFRDAAKIAAIQMLQEDFSNEITKHFALYSCLKYLESPVQWIVEEAREEVEQEEDEEEIVKIRVQYLRNPYFDGHFDLTTANDLIGKTLMTIGRSDPDDVLHQSYYLVGLGLTKNTQESKQFLVNVQNDKIKVTRDALEMFKKFIITEDVSQTTSNPVEPAASEGENSEAAPNPAELKANVSEEIQAIMGLAEGLTSKGTEGNLLQVTENNLKNTVQKFEAQEIEKQKQKYQLWDTEREQILKKHLDKLKEEQIFDNIQKKKEDLAKEEERLFFFDNENEIDLLLEKKYPPKKEVVVKKRNEFDGKRNLGRTVIGKRQKLPTEESYVPPDMHKPYK
uniref:28S ribosomal protein S27, mitochondrial n=1 Tax=Cacopsylla melanoneura TaxID=428564 RepID=A0A8D8VE61_9HEMI